jgi:hypothetical protein
MKIPFFQDSRAKRNLLDNGEDLFEHCNKLLDHLTPGERDRFRRYLTNQWYRGREERRSKQMNFRNKYK